MTVSADEDSVWSDQAVVAVLEIEVLEPRVEEGSLGKASSGGSSHRRVSSRGYKRTRNDLAQWPSVVRPGKPERLNKHAILVELCTNKSDGGSAG